MAILAIIIFSDSNSIIIELSLMPESFPLIDLPFLILTMTFCPTKLEAMASGSGKSIPPIKSVTAVANMSTYL